MDDKLILKQRLLAWQEAHLSSDFNHYLTSTQAQLTEYYGEGHPLLQEITPFEWVPPDFFKQDKTKRRAILLIHGLLGTSAQLYDIGQAFLQQGYLVRSVLLTGHGLTYKALDHVVWQDWAEIVTFACQELTHVVDKFVILGYSCGGALAMQQALNAKMTGQDGISHLIAIAPPLRVNSPIDFMIPWIAKWPIPLHFSSHHYIKSLKYPYFSQYSANQARLLAKTTKRELLQHALTIPGFFVLAEHDETVDSKLAKKLLLKTNNPNLEICWYSRHEPNTEDKRLYWRSSYYPELDIQDYTHTSLCASPDNPLEGLTAYCQAYETARSNKMPLPRLSFNPDFAYMVSAMLSFCEKVV